ncbi:hypothetical protein ACFE04_002196 [Oxalis oulophora]
MGDHTSASYIHMVHHLIEECILFNMNKEECMEALYKHANIKPVITSTVWNELEKENKEFFEAYSSSQQHIRSSTTTTTTTTTTQIETKQRIQNTLLSITASKKDSTSQS